jgi:hypothetical protein
MPIQYFSTAIIRGRRSSRQKIVSAERLLLVHLLSVVPNATLLVGRKRVTIQEIAAQVGAHMDAARATDEARARLADLVIAEEEARVVSCAAVTALRAYARVVFGDTSLQCSTLGFAPQKKVVKSVATKAVAATRSAATRKQRNTLGKRQKAKTKRNASR